MVRDPPAGIALPCAKTYFSPSNSRSCTAGSCGEDNEMSPDFFIKTATLPTGTGRIWEKLTFPVVYGKEYATCTGVGPGGNGPITVTRSPRATAFEEPPTIVVPCAPVGMSSRNAFGGLTGARALF